MSGSTSVAARPGHGFVWWLAACSLLLVAPVSAQAHGDEANEGEHGAHEGEHAAGHGADVEPSRAIPAAKEALEAAEKAYQNGNVEEAKKKVRKAHLQKFEPLERQLSSKDKKLTAELERRFHILNPAMEAGDDQRVREAFEELDGLLDESKAVLASQSSSWSVAVASGGIILREGIEAVLLIAIFLGTLVRLEEERAKKYIHAGWIAALIAGVGTWLFSQYLVEIAPVGREMLEGIVALLAAAVLFWVSYWLFSHLHGERWIEALRERVHRAVEGGGSKWALVGLAFLAVYREAFETVLMYQGLMVGSEGHVGAITGGFAAGVAVLAVVAYFILAAGRQLPLGPLFTATSVILYGLCLVLVGSGIHELQEAGVLASYPVDFIEISALGIYPDFVSLIVQGLLVVGAFVAAVVKFDSLSD
ncbi:MAG: FTR1 family protein [Bradymonadaceae bacterium]